LQTIYPVAALQATIILTPWTREAFKLTPFNPERWLLALGLGMMPLLAMEVWKGARRGFDSFLKESAVKRWWAVQRSNLRPAD